MLKRLLALPRKTKKAIALSVDVSSLVFAFWFAQSVRLEQPYWPDSWGVVAMLLMALPISLLVFIRLGLYRAVVRYVSSRAQIAVLVGVSVSALLMYFCADLFSVNLRLSAAIIYAMTAALLIGSSRQFMRVFYRYSTRHAKHNVLIYGAGAAGRQLAQALLGGQEYRPVGFIDDDQTLHGSTMLGINVYSAQCLQQLVEKRSVTRLLLAIPSTSRSNRKRIIELLEPIGVQVQTIPGMADMVDGKMSIDQLQDVRIEDLLGRDPVVPDRLLMNTNIQGKSVMVTGAGGSIGSELCRQIVKLKPAVLVLYELSEFGLYAIERELRQLCQQENMDVDIHPIIGTVQRRNRIAHVMSSFKIDTVYHAAAYKHVPLVEYNVVEGIRNNVFGTWHTAEAAIASGVENFVLISTDKAVRPTNTMGASKRLAELVLQGLSKRQTNTHFCMVRFGNVLGSSGSVVPLFREQIRKGGPVTVTHPDIIRYFMTIPEAAQLVIQAGSLSYLKSKQTEHGAGGDVFVLDMGEPVKILDLAKRMIKLMGRDIRSPEQPQGDISIQFSGLRPGEKLYEELLIGDEVEETSHPRIMRAMERSMLWDDVQSLLNSLDEACHDFKIAEIRRLLLEAPTDFAPSDDICDLLWIQNDAKAELLLGKTAS